jgi:RNA polymerase sigma factor (sigma-70 family)
MRRAYLGTDGHDIAWDLIRAPVAPAWPTPRVHPMQDVLVLPTDCRMNLPGRPAAGGCGALFADPGVQVQRGPGRARRRQVKLVQVARERWRSSHGSEATAAEISPLCGLSVNDIFALEAEAMQAQTVSSSESDDSEDPDDGGRTSQREPATPQDEVEARVDTGMLLRRLEAFFAKLPERDRQVIDAYLGVGLSPVELAQALKVSPSRLSQMFKAVCDRVGVHMGHAGQRSTDRARVGGRARLDDLITERERELVPPVRRWQGLGRRPCRRAADRRATSRQRLPR